MFYAYIHNTIDGRTVALEVTPREVPFIEELCNLYPEMRVRFAPID